MDIKAEQILELAKERFPMVQKENEKRLAERKIEEEQREQKNTITHCKIIWETIQKELLERVTTGDGIPVCMMWVLSPKHEELVRFFFYEEHLQTRRACLQEIVLKAGLYISFSSGDYPTIIVEPKGWEAKILEK